MAWVMMSQICTWSSERQPIGMEWRSSVYATHHCFACSALADGFDLPGSWLLAASARLSAICKSVCSVLIQEGLDCFEAMSVVRACRNAVMFKNHLSTVGTITFCLHLTGSNICMR